MRQIAYTSVATTELGQDDVFRIVETSASNNMAHGITGFLVYSGSQFFQVVEAPDPALQRLLDTLRRDPRHKDIRILHDEPVAAPRFPRWRMQRVRRSGDAMLEVRAELGRDAAGQKVLALLHQFLTNDHLSRSAA